MKYLHVMVPSKRMMFGFISMLRNHFPSNEHPILFREAIPQSESILLQFSDTIDFKSYGKGKINKWKGLMRDMSAADHIIIHGMNLDIKWIIFLYAHKKILKKCSWVIWGIDLYNYLRSGRGLKIKLLNKIETACRKSIKIPIALNECDIEIYHQLIDDRPVLCAGYPISDQNWLIMDNYIALKKEEELHVSEDEKENLEEKKENWSIETEMQNSNLRKSTLQKTLENDSKTDDTEAKKEKVDHNESENTKEDTETIDAKIDFERSFKLNIDVLKNKNEVKFSYKKTYIDEESVDDKTSKSAACPVDSTSFNNPQTVEKPKKQLKMMVGNNAHSFNNHSQALFDLAHLSGENIKIYIPISYGNDYHSSKKYYIDGIRQIASELYPSKTVAFMTKLISQKDYTQHLTNIDVGVYNAERQNALGNINKLLYMGKKVYLSDKNPLYKFYISKGLEIHNINELKNISFEELERPISIDYPNPWFKEYYSSDGCAKYWDKVFKTVIQNNGKGSK